MNRLSTAFIVAVAAVVAVGAGARADFIPWTYSWSADPQVSTGAGGGISLYTTSGAATGSQPISSGVDLLAFAPNSTTPQMLNNALYNLTLNLTDVNSGATASLPFSGTLSGNVLTGSVLNTFNTPLTQTVPLGGNQYAVTIGYYTPAGAAGSGVWGSLGANVVVSAPAGTNPVASVPEPTGLVLGSMAVLGLGCWCWRERRRLKGTAPMAA